MSLLLFALAVVLLEHDWQREKVLLVGYSRGASVLPFAASRLPPDLLGRVQAIALLSPGLAENFEVHLMDFFRSVSRRTGLPVLPEIENLRGRRILCFYGEEDLEAAELCTSLDPALAESLRQPGGHHFAESHKSVADVILARAADRPAP